MGSLFLFIGIISFLIIIHELGHFFAAKKIGVKVEEFGLGLPPKIWGKKYKETEFTLNFLPFGGFVRLKGEEELSDDSDSFESKGVYQRAFVVVAGVLMNLLLAVIIYQATLHIRDYRSDYFPILGNIKPYFGDLEVTSGLISGLTDESKIDKTRIAGGDYIYSINNNLVTSNTQLRELVNNSQEGRAFLVIKNLRDTSLVKEFEVELTEKDSKKYLGIYLGEAGRVSYDNTNPLLVGVLHSLNIAKLSLESLGLLISKSVENNDISIVSDNVAGPVGIYSVVDSIKQSNESVFSLEIFELVAMLSLSLAIMNILPIPAVDGGRLVFLMYEMVLRKKLNSRVEMAVNRFGMLFLLALIISITVKDLSNLLNF
jgi:regulator of sigma E protease